LRRHLPSDVKSRETETKARVVLASRTMIGAFAARLATLGWAWAALLPPHRLPKHVRYRCATPHAVSCVDRVHSATLR
jgi:hypothetical protein